MLSLVFSTLANARSQLRFCTSSKKLLRACSGVEALALKPGSALPEAMPTVPPARPTLVRPRNINNTVKATTMMTIGRVPFMSLSSSYVMSFAFFDRAGRFNYSPDALSGGKEQHQEHGQHTYPDRERAPKQSHPCWRYCIRIDSMCGRHVIFRPDADFAVVKDLRFSP